MPDVIKFDPARKAPRFNNLLKPRPMSREQVRGVVVRATFDAVLRQAAAKTGGRVVLTD